MTGHVRIRRLILGALALAASVNLMLAAPSAAAGVGKPALEPPPWTCFSKDVIFYYGAGGTYYDEPLFVLTACYSQGQTYIESFSVDASPNWGISGYGAIPGYGPNNGNTTLWANTQYTVIPFDHDYPRLLVTYTGTLVCEDGGGDYYTYYGCDFL